jgi:hypothetical protein
VRGVPAMADHGAEVEVEEGIGAEGQGSRVKGS